MNGVTNILLGSSLLQYLLEVLTLSILYHNLEEMDYISRERHVL